MKRLSFLVLSVLVMSSCIGIESRISFKANGSGTLTFNYKISRMIKDLDSAGSGGNLPLPVSEEDFVRTAEGIEGLKLINIKQSEDEENIYIEAKMEFDRIESVRQIGSGGQMEVSLVQAGGDKLFTQVIYPGREDQEIYEDTLQMLETFFKDYELSFVIDAPEPIKSHNLGVLSQNNRQLTYTVTITELMKTGKETILEVRW